MDRQFRGIVNMDPSGLGPMLGAGWGRGRRVRPNVVNLVPGDVAVLSRGVSMRRAQGIVAAAGVFDENPESL